MGHESNFQAGLSLYRSYSGVKDGNVQHPLLTECRLRKAGAEESRSSIKDMGQTSRYTALPVNHHMNRQGEGIQANAVGKKGNTTERVRSDFPSTIPALSMALRLHKGVVPSD